MIITDLLKQNREEYGDEVALVELNPNSRGIHKTWKEYNLVETGSSEKTRRQLTWKEFDDAANRCSALLYESGVRKGDKVGILMMNCLEWLPIYFGVLKLGALAVPFNFRFSSDEIKYCANLSDISVLFFGFEFIGRIEEIYDAIPKVKTLFYVGDNCPTFADNYLALSADMPCSAPQVDLTEDDYAAIYFSSGTTGFPKAILHKHRSLIHSARVEQNHHGQTHEDVFLCIPPLYHTGAKMHWFGSLMVGGRSVLLKGTKPEDILGAVSAEHCSIVWLLVPWAQDILDQIESGEVNLDDYSLSQWRLMHIGAQPVPPSLIKRWKEVFPYHDYDTNYGLSESIGPGCVHLGLGNEHKVGAIGKAGFGWETMILDENRKPVARGEVGELAVKGPGVMECYYKDPKATSEVLFDGWLLTGDMAEEDEDGFIYLVDRKKDVIITGGENLYPVQIENYIRAFSPVKDVAVIGLPDARLGEIAAAIVEVKDGFTCTEEDIRNFCNGLPRYKRPRKIIFAEIPRNATGKIEKPRLRKIYCDESVVMKQLKS